MVQPGPDHEPDRMIQSPSRQVFRMVSTRQLTFSGMVLSIVGIIFGVAALERHLAVLPAVAWLDGVFVIGLVLLAFTQAHLTVRLSE